jgi:O-antigen/teichoic acid export membrane protein
VSVIGLAILGFALSVREFASSSFLIQREILTREDVQASFTVMLIMTAAIVSALLATTPILTRVYAEEKLASYFHVVCVCLFLDLVSIQVITLLRRKMAYTRIVAIDVAGAILGAVTTIVLALSGFSYMSFAWAWLVTSLVAGAASVAAYPQPWIFKPSLRNWRGMVSFGGYNGAAVLLYKLYDTLPYILFGWVLSAHAAAIFSRSVMICQLPNKLILGGAVSVVLPAFSEEFRQGRSLRQPYLHALGLATVLQWPALFVLSILADPVVNVVLGSQWVDVVPLVRIISIASLFTFSFQINYPVMVAMGAMRASFIRALISFPLSALIMICAIFVGGLQAAAWSMMFIVPFQAIVAISFIKRRLQVRYRDIIFVLWKSAVTALLTTVGPIIVLAATNWNWHFSLASAAVAIGAAAICWGIGLLVTGHPLLAELTEPLAMLRLKLSTRSRTASLSR